MRKFLLLMVAVAAAIGGGSAIAEPVVKTIGIADARALLVRPEQPVASVVLIPGGDGRIEVGFDGQIQHLHDDLLVRTRFDFAARGLAVLVVDADVKLDLAVDTMRRIKSPVTVVATSNGTLRAAHGIADGARPDALVLVSGILTGESGYNENVAKILATPERLPRTLVIHHRRDECNVARPAGVPPFVKWANGRARVVWLDGGHNGGKPCDVQTYHGFAGLEAKVVSVSATFR